MIRSSSACPTASSAPRARSTRSRWELAGGSGYAAFASGISMGGGTLSDQAVLLFDANGSLLAYQDDSGYPELGWDPLFEFVAPYSGVYYVGVTDLYGGSGSYGVQLVDTTHYGS